MKKIIVFEIKKIIKNPLLIVGLIAMIVLSISYIFASLSSYTYLDASGRQLQGFRAIQYEKRDKKSVEGYITSDKIDEMVDYYQEIISVPGNLTDDGYLSNAGYKDWQKYDDIGRIISFTYASEGMNYDPDAIKNMKKGDGDIFYKNVDKMIERKLQENYFDNFSAKEVDQLRSMGKSVDTPYYYAYFNGWDIALRNISTFFMALTILMCICVATAFSNENHTKMDSVIFSSRYGRNKVFTSKIISCLIFSTVFFIVGITIFTACHFLTFGVSGWNVSIQLLLVTAPYNLSFLEAYLTIILLGYLAYICIMMLSLLGSVLLKNNFRSIVLVAVIFMVPEFISRSPFNRMFNTLIYFLPIKMMNPLIQLNLFELFPFFGFSIPVSYAASIITLFAIIALYVITMIVYKKQQVTNS